MSEFYTVDISSAMDDISAIFDFPGEFLEVRPGMDLGERFRRIKHNYRRKQAMVDAKLDDWFRSDPYEVAYWPALFTPIEASLWSDIRRWSLDLWPQLPVGGFFVDFGNPVARIAVECDGAEWHKDKDKDARRDRALNDMGWRVVRINGRMCKTEILSSEEAEYEKDIDPEDYDEWRDRETPYLALVEIRERLRGYREMVDEELRRRYSKLGLRA